MDFIYFAEGAPHNVADEHRRRIDHQVHERWRLRDAIDPLQMSLTEFKKLFRMAQHDVVTLSEIIRPYMPQPQNADHTPLVTKLLAALSFYAGGTYQRMLGRSADIALSQSSISRFIRQVTMALNHVDVLNMFIQFPLSRQERNEVILLNEELGMPRVLGFIDGTLVRITPPPYNMDRQAYYSRKKFPAINAQIICDATLRILNVNARFPGSSNDHFIWSSSAVLDVVREAYFEDRCWLLGDGGYFTAPWLHIPILHAEEGTPEFNYTELHMSCRNCVERCIGVLKARWRCLCADRALTYRPVFAGHIINACCVLHNFCIQRQLPNPHPVIERDRAEPPFDDDLPMELRERALAERQYLIDYAHQRKQRRGF